MKQAQDDTETNQSGNKNEVLKDKCERAFVLSKQNVGGKMGETGKSVTCLGTEHG